MAAIRLATAFVEITTKGLQSTQQAFGGLRSGIQSSLDQITKIITPIGAASGAMLGFGIAAAESAETVETSFKVMLGSVERARDMIAELNKFSLVTPFTPAEVNQAARTLLQFTVEADKLLPTMNLIGDVAAGTGADLSQLALVFGQIKSTGRLMGQDLLQLITAGFNPLNVIAEKTGKSIAQLKKEMEQGKISFAMVEQAFRDATSEGGLFNNAMSELAKTSAGLRSTFQGNLGEIGKLIGRSILPQFKALLGVGISLSKRFIDLNTATGGLAAQLVAVNMAAFSAAGSLTAAALAARLLGITGKGILISTGVGAVLVGLGSLVAWLMHANEQAEEGEEKISRWSGAFAKFNLAWENLKAAAMPVFDALRDGITMLGEAFGFNMDHMAGSFLDMLAGVLEKNAEFILSISEGIRVVAENWGTVWDLIKTTAMLSLSAVMDFFSTLPEALAQSMGFMARKIIDGVTSMAETMLKIMESAIAGLADLIGKLPKLAQTALTEGVDAAQKLASSIVDAVVSKAQGMGDAFTAGLEGEAPDFFKPSDRTMKLLEDQKKLFDDLKAAKEELEGGRAARLAVPRPPVAPGDDEAPAVAAAPTSGGVPGMKAGFTGFADLQRSIQAAFVKKDDPTEKLVGLSEKHNTLLEKIIKNTEGGNPIPIAE